MNSRSRYGPAEMGLLVKIVKPLSALNSIFRNRTDKRTRAVKSECLSGSYETFFITARQWSVFNGV